DRVALAGETAYERIDLPDDDPTWLPPVPVAVPVGPGRHSATSLLTHARCGRRYWLRYVAGLREPLPFGSSDALISPVARGQIVHDVIERYEEDAELDR